MHNSHAQASRSTASTAGSILLFGLPRSGTTWLGKLFDSHPDTLYRHEPDTSHRFSMPRFPSSDDVDTYAPMVREFAGQLPRMNAPRIVGKLPLFSKSYMSAPRKRLLEGSVLLSRGASRFFPEFPVLVNASGKHHPRRRLVWKSIESLGRMRTVLDSLDDAVGIHILRHPCGQIASLERGFGKKPASSRDYGIFRAVLGTERGDYYGLTMDYLESLAPVERLAWRWVLINEKTLDECSDLGRFMCVRYEDICADPMSGVDRMFSFAGLDMNDQTRDFIEASTNRSSDGYYSVFRNPEQAAWRWREELDEATVARIMAIVSRSRMGQYYS